MSLDIRALTGADLDCVLPDLARLRMEVFRDWPYLYDGTFDYEHRYLQSYRDSAGAIVVGAFDGDTLVGAATGTVLEDHADEFAMAFAGQDMSCNKVFYCAESVLLPRYRGQGAGHVFFDLREAHARALGRTYTAFCAVIRPDDHTMRPTDYRPLNPFWRARGYAPLPGAIAQFAWLDVGDTAPNTKDMQFWIRAL